MKIFVVGGVSVLREHTEYEVQLPILNDCMGRIGSGLIHAGHDVLVCSPYPGSADREAVRGAVEAFPKRLGPSVEFHTPNLPQITEQLDVLSRSLPMERVKLTLCSISSDERGEPELTYTWLLAQLHALNSSHVVLALGGRLGGSASLLLPVAENQHRHILPFTFLGGAAAQCFERRRYELMDRFGDAIGALQERARVDEAVQLLETLPQVRNPHTERPAPARVFLSYPFARPLEADIVHAFLQRKGYDVDRDKVTFGAGRSLPGEIRESIYRADLFVVIWCQEYACSPWCFDEIDLALTRHRDSGLTLWILRVDDTRIVPPGARDLLAYHTRSQDELERTLLKLHWQFQDATGAAGRDRGTC